MAVVVAFLRGLRVVNDVALVVEDGEVVAVNVGEIKGDKICNQNMNCQNLQNKTSTEC